MEKRIELEMRGRAAAQITELNLDNCRSTNIVGLTDEFENLGKLSLINVGLTSLKGFPKLPKLKKLELSDNRISSGLGGLSEACPAITNLNMSGNRLKDLEELKPLGKLEHLEVLDLFNNEVTSVDSYRDKVFAMIPSLKYLDGFDPKDGEAPSEGEDDEDANGFNGSEDAGAGRGTEQPDSDDSGGRFCINGLEIDLDELDAFERKVEAKKRVQEGTPSGGSTADAPDYLDEYLERLQISRANGGEEEIDQKQVAEGGSVEDQVVSPAARYSFLRLLLMFMSLMSMAKLLNKNYDKLPGEEDSDEDGSDVSLSEVLNDELADDSSDWSENEEGEEEDEDEDDSDEEADVSTKKKDDSTVAEGDDKDDEEDDGEEARGKKRKHDE